MVIYYFFNVLKIAKVRPLVCQKGPYIPTVRANRLLGVPLPPPKEMQKKERGVTEVCSDQMYLLMYFNGWITRQ